MKKSTHKQETHGGFLKRGWDATALNIPFI